MAAARALVVVARPDPSPTDALADRLRDVCTVRTAYSTEDVLDRLDEEVDAVLLDPDLTPGPVSVVRETIDRRTLDCQIGLLAETERPDGPPAGVDAVVPLAASDERVRETVVWLAMRAQYRKALDEYYELAQTSASLERAGEDADVGDELDRLHGQIEELRRRLDETADELDTLSLFEAALRRDLDE